MQNNGQPRRWADVAASEQFRALDPERQERARQLYFDDVVLPRVPAGSEARARELFDQDTAATIGKAEEQGGVGAMDYLKEAGAGVLKGTGAIVSGLGDAIRPDDIGLKNAMPGGPEGPKIRSFRELAADAIDPAARAVGGWLDDKGQAVADSKSQAAKQAQANSTPTGDVFDPSSWDMGADPSVAGYGLHMAGLAGQFAPQAGVMLATRGNAQAQSSAMMGVGGLQAGGAAANDVEQRIQDTPDAELQQSSEVYRALRQKLDEPAARAELLEQGRNAAFRGAAPVGALGGLATQVTLGPLQNMVGGGVGKRLAAGLVFDAPAEGAQEVAETMAARYSTNAALGEQRSVTEDTFGDAVLGMMGGAGHASLGAALGGDSRASARQQGEQQADADFDSTPEPAALPAPGLAGLPPPAQVFYGDQQGNLQDTGPVRSVDGQQQPDQQARAWINPQNDPAKGGGPGMDQQTPRGEPAPLEGQLQLGARQDQAVQQQRDPLTIDAEPERAALPAPETIVVDAEGNAQRGPVAPQVPAEQVPGGRGMDQQAPTAPPRDRSQAELLRKANGKPFDAPKGAEASKAFRDARAAGRQPQVVPVDGGYAIKLQPELVRHEMRPIDVKANEAATSPTNDLPAPTAAQIEAGNYKKGKVRVHGLELSIENPRGSERSGTGPDGTEWRHTMSDHYGYIRRTVGADGEAVDVYLGPQEDSGQVFIVDQLNQQDGTFDEHKVMLGYADEASAVDAYRSNFDAGWKVGKVTAMPVAEFKDWLKGDTTKPMAEVGTGAAAKQGSAEQDQVAWEADKVSLEAVEQGAPAIPERADFTLTGSDRPSDVAAARVQQDLLGGSDQLYRHGSEPGDNKGQQGQVAVEQLREALAAAPELSGVVVVQSFEDLPLSTRTRAKRDGVAPDELRGVRSSGKTYVVAGAHNSLADAIYTAVHEEVGHRGIRGLLGDELDATMERLYSSQQATAKGRQRIGQIRDAYASVLERMDAKQQRLVVAQEIVAHLLEDGERPTMLQRVLSKVRELLRKMFPQVPWTYTDILALGEQARDWLRRQNGQQDADRAVLYSRHGWTESFPDTVLAHPLSFLNNHPDYAAAKAGDDAAALRVARDAVTPEFVEQVRALIPEGSQPRIVPVLAVEGAGKNRIPLMAAEVLAQRLGLETDTAPVQAEKVGRTQSSALERIANQPTFAGRVAKGDYLIIDDTLTQGGTLAQLKTHIEDNGGRVLGATALTGKNYSRKLSLDPSTLAEVRGKYGSIEPWWRDTFGYSFEGLTQSEARTLLTFDKGQLSPEQLRDRVAATRDAGLFRVGEAATADRPGTEASVDPDENLYSLAGARRPHVADAHPDLNADEQAALRKIAPPTARERAIDWYQERTDRISTKVRRGLVDKYAALKELDEAAHGADFIESSITSSAWVLARMAPAAAGALNAMMHNGRIVLDSKQKVIGMRGDGSMGLGEVFSRLGDAAEIDRFLGWIAGNRAAKLAAEGRENLFDAQDIAALKGINRGTTADGRSRAKLYDEVFREFQQYRDDVLAIAEQTGIISPENRAMWRDEFYVPFYRVMDEEAKAGGPTAAKGLSRQEAYKKLKGGKQNLNDLLENTLMNFHHLLTASLKNQAAQQAITNAEQLGIARVVPEAARDPKSSTFVLKGGQRVFYQVDDALVFEALTSLADPGLNNFAVRVMSSFKRVFTNMTTITLQFITANFMRDSMQAAATSPVSKNIGFNMYQGIRAFRDQKTRAQMLASGGAFSFGHIYGADPEEVKAGLRRGLRGAKLVDGPKLVPKLLVAGWDAYNAFANTAENANRAAIFLQNQDKGTLRAAFEARDLMDFSQEGAWPAVRFLIRVVPFLNARLQGLDKLYRAGVKPAVLTAFGKGTASDKQAAARFGVVTGALALASIALYLANHDDEEYRKLEDWQKDSYWFFRIGDQAFFVPKPFEVGAVSTLAERLTEQLVDDKASGKLLRDRLWAMVTQTFAFSPVPQAFQPALDVYSNKDAFTGRPIESAGMERVSPTLRARSTTTAPAHLISEATSVLGDDFTLSPLQADHLIRGYLGQIGAWGAGMVDTIWRTAKGEDEPAKRWHEYQPIRRFYKDLGAPAPYDRYSTLFYEGLKESGRVYADVKRLQELGRNDEARELVAEKRGMLALRRPLGAVQRKLSAINARMDMVRQNGWDGERKRAELDRLLVIKNRLTEIAGKRIETVRAGD